MGLLITSFQSIPDLIFYNLDEYFALECENAVEGSVLIVKGAANLAICELEVYTFLHAGGTEFKFYLMFHLCS